MSTSRYVRGESDLLQCAENVQNANWQSITFIEAWNLNININDCDFSGNKYRIWWQKFRTGSFSMRPWHFPTIFASSDSRTVCVCTLSSRFLKKTDICFGVISFSAIGWPHSQTERPTSLIEVSYCSVMLMQISTVNVDFVSCSHRSGLAKFVDSFWTGQNNQSFYSVR